MQISNLLSYFEMDISDVIVRYKSQILLVSLGDRNIRRCLIVSYKSQIFLDYVEI